MLRLFARSGLPTGLMPHRVDAPAQPAAEGIQVPDSGEAPRNRAGSNRSGASWLSGLVGLGRWTGTDDATGCGGPRRRRVRRGAFRRRRRARRGTVQRRHTGEIRPYLLATTARRLTTHQLTPIPPSRSGQPLLPASTPTWRVVGGGVRGYMAGPCPCRQDQPGECPRARAGAGPRGALAALDRGLRGRVRG